MSDLTIPARLVAEGAGLPAVWRDSYCGAWQNDRSRKGEVDLSDPQTAFGCALKLDEWERAQRIGEIQHFWARNLSRWHDNEETGRPEFAAFLRRMIAHLRVIGEDAMIRRAMGWPVKNGTLASVWRDTTGRWYMATDDDAAWWDSWPGITDPDEARTAIWREVCGG